LQPVCATNGKTYSTSCALRRAACLARDSELRQAYAGPCTWEDKNCRMNCEDDEDEDDAPVKPVCTSDGVVHKSECHFKRSACRGDRTQPVVIVACPEGTTYDSFRVREQVYDYND